MAAHGNRSRNNGSGRGRADSENQAESGKLAGSGADTIEQRDGASQSKPDASASSSPSAASPAPADMSATTGDGGERKGDGESEPTDTGQPSSEAAEQQPGHEQEQGNRTAHDAKSQRQDATGTQKPQGNPLQSGQGPSMAEQAGHLAGSAMRNVHENSRHNPLYLGMAIAFGVASLGAAFSTFPIFISLPVAGVLLGISVWLMGHVGVISLKSDQTPRRHGRLLRTATIGNLVGAQIVVTDVFLFTRLGSVAPGQSSMVVAWLIATALESLGAAIIVAADLFHRH